MHNPFRTMFFKRPVHNVVYAYAALGYGTIRKGVQVYDAEVPVRSCAHRSFSFEQQPEEAAAAKRQPMLLTTKLLLAGFCGLASVYGWPYYACVDLNRLEMHLRSKSPADYGERAPEDVLDYVFT